LDRWRKTSSASVALIALRLCLICGLGLHAPTSRASDERGLTFSLRGKTLSTRVFDELERLATADEVRVFEPYEGKPATFRALPFNQILDAIYGDKWRNEEELLITCRDGYQPAFPVRRLLDYRAWLAFDRTDSAAFSILKLESGARRPVDLSPYYLVWENLDDLELRRQGDYGWPYQLVGVDLIRTRDRFPAMTPKEGAAPDVLAGFAAFRVHCSHCHAINGEGGGIGPELNHPVSPVEYREAEWLRKWIKDPASLVPAARMPALNRELADRDRVIDEILAYLVAISKHKSLPKLEQADAT
jgi:mono/diheme cytochrome c family protein